MSKFRPVQSIARDVVRFAIGLLVAMLLARTWLAQTFFVPSGSMAPTLLGLHRAVTCPECSFTFACGSDGTTAERPAVCPNCGAIGKPLDEAPLTGGDRVLVAKGAFELRAPRRWEVIAFRAPEHASDIQVKRVVGLPGEAVQIRAGDVYINGQIQRKNWSEQRAVGMLLHDDRFRAHEKSPPRTQWRATADSRWTVSANGMSFEPEAGESATNDAKPLDWLTWQHFATTPGEVGHTEEAPVVDRYAYNQGQVFRDSNPVRDLFWTCRFHVRGRGQLLLSATDGQIEYRAQLDLPRNRVELIRGEESVATAELPDLSAGDHNLGVSLVDQQFLLAIDDKVVLASQLERPAADRPTSRPFAIACRGMGVFLQDLQVFRDIYYTVPPGLVASAGLQSQYRLADDEYYVLGDNSPDSLDSRFVSAGPAVAAKLLLGKPLLVYFPSRWASVAGLRFQVPEITRIRYIR